VALARSSTPGRVISEPPENALIVIATLPTTPSLDDDEFTTSPPARTFTGAFSAPHSPAEALGDAAPQPVSVPPSAGIITGHLTPASAAARNSVTAPLDDPAAVTGTDEPSATDKLPLPSTAATGNVAATDELLSVVGVVVEGSFRGPEAGDDASPDSASADSFITSLGSFSGGPEDASPDSASADSFITSLGSFSGGPEDASPDSASADSFITSLRSTTVDRPANCCTSAPASAATTWDVTPSSAGSTLPHVITLSSAVLLVRDDSSLWFTALSETASLWFKA